MPRIYLTDHEREFLKLVVDIDATTVAEMISFADTPADVFAAVPRVLLHARLWEAATTGTLDVDDAVTARLEGWKESNLRGLSSHHEALTTVKSGTSVYKRPGQPYDLAEEEASIRAEADRDLDEIAALDAILARAGVIA